LFAVAQQLRMFLATALTGVVLAAAFDWHRAWRAALRPRGWRGHVLDLAFVPVGACIVAGGLLAANWGDLRAYAFAGLALGAWAYARLASPVLLAVDVAVVRATLAAGHALLRLLTWPYRVGRRAAGGAGRVGRGVLGRARRMGAGVRSLARRAGSWLPRPPKPPPPG
jgi:spore cortex biosynthesis protein YabQ